MKTFNDLELFGTREALDALVTSIEASLANGWKRDKSAEDEGSSRAGLDYCCFTCDKRDSREGAGLFLLPDADRNCLEVVNICPLEVGELSSDQYNRILEDFHLTFVKPLARKHNVRAKLSSPRPWTPRPLRGALKCALGSVTAAYQRTSSVAFKTRALHPSDHQRYWRFIRVAHQYQSTLRPADIAFALSAAGFHAELVAELEREYEIGRRVLAVHDEPWELRRLRKEERRRRKQADAIEYERVFGKPPNGRD